MEWIKFKDRKPPDDVPVLVCDKWGHDGQPYIYAALYHYDEYCENAEGGQGGFYWIPYNNSGHLDDAGSYDDWDDDYNYEYWMPLPQPPEKE